MHPHPSACCRSPTLTVRSLLPPPRLRSLAGGLCVVLMALLALAPLSARAWDLAGPHAVLLHARDGSRLQLGTVTFGPADNGRRVFTLVMDPTRFKDFFLSMKEFKCVEGGREVFCHVPYPYPQPGTVRVQPDAIDLAWLEHSLLFMFKTPTEFGAKLWNGVYFQLRLTDQGLEGRPQAVDLNRISAPPDKPAQPPFGPALRDDIAPGARWFERLTIE